MQHFLEYPTPSGTVLVEIDSGKPASRELVGKIASVEEPAPALITKAKQQFDSALTVVHETAAALVGQVNRMVDKPSQVEVTFGLKANTV
jgi:hypothetical protein